MENACLDLEEIPAVLIKTKQAKIVQWDQYQSQSNTKRMESDKDEEYLQ
jgi:tRNA G37 N-methylase TrmD